MPVIKREQTISECLNNAVSEQLNIYETTVSRLERPVEHWYKGQKYYDEKAKHDARKEKYKFDIDRVMGVHGTEFVPQYIRELYDIVMDKIFRFCMDDCWIPLCLFCAKLNLNYFVRCLRLPVGFVAMFILMHEAPNTDVDAGGTWLDTVVRILDIALLIGFLCGSLVRFLSIPIMIRIERSFDRKPRPWHMLLVSGGIRDIPLIIAALIIGMNPTGMWIRLVLLMSLTSSLIEAIPHLEILLGSITHALASISITISLFFIALLIYASFGYVIFRQNDPYHFGTLGLSIWTFFRFAIFDSWADLWHLNSGGCDEYPTIDIIMDFDRQHQQPIHTEWGTFHRGTCIDPESRPVLSTIVMVSFLFICAYVLVNSCTVAVVVGIKTGLETFKNMSIVGKNIEALKKNEISQRTSSNGPRRSSVTSSANPSTRSGFGSNSNLLFNNFFLKAVSMKEIVTVSELLQKIWDGVEPVSVDKINYAKKYGPWTRPQRIAMELNRVLDHKSYMYSFLLLSLMVAGLQICIDSRVVTETEALPLNIFSQVMFTLNILVRFFTYIHHQPDKLSQWGWLLFGFILTSVLWVPVFSDIELIHPFRMLRLVGALQYLSWIKDLELIMTAFTVSLYGLALLGCLVIIAFLFFSVAAVMLFKDADPYKFGSIRSSIVSLLQLMSYDGVEYMIRTSMLGCNHFGYQTPLADFNKLCKANSQGVGWIAPIFCVVFCVVCSIILMSALIGLIISSMESLMEIKSAEVEIWKDVAEVAEAYELQYHTVMWMLDVFDLLDEEGHCHLTFLELGEMFEEAGINEESDQFAMFLNVDRDGSGQIEFPEFCELVAITGVLIDRSPFENEKIMAAAERIKEEEVLRKSYTGTPGGMGSAGGVTPPRKPRSNYSGYEYLSEGGRPISEDQPVSQEPESFHSFELRPDDDDRGGLLFKPRMSTKRAASRKIMRGFSTKSRMKTREELFEHILGTGSGEYSHKFGNRRGGGGSGEGSASGSVSSRQIPNGVSRFRQEKSGSNSASVDRSYSSQYNGSASNAVIGFGNVSVGGPGNISANANALQSYKMSRMKYAPPSDKPMETVGDTRSIDDNSEQGSATRSAANGSHLRPQFTVKTKDLGASRAPMISPIAEGRGSSSKLNSGHNSPNGPLSAYSSPDAGMSAKMSGSGTARSSGSGKSAQLIPSWFSGKRVSPIGGNEEAGAEAEAEAGAETGQLEPDIEARGGRGGDIALVGIDTNSGKTDLSATVNTTPPKHATASFANGKTNKLQKGFFKSTDSGDNAAAVDPEPTTVPDPTLVLGAPEPIMTLSHIHSNVPPSDTDKNLSPHRPNKISLPPVITGEDSRTHTGAGDTSPQLLGMDGTIPHHDVVNDSSKSDHAVLSAY